jgi:hypothetical protein
MPAVEHAALLVHLAVLQQAAVLAETLRQHSSAAAWKAQQAFVTQQTMNPLQMGDGIHHTFIPDRGCPVLYGSS